MKFNERLGKQYLIVGRLGCGVRGVSCAPTHWETNNSSVTNSLQTFRHCNIDQTILQTNVFIQGTDKPQETRYPFMCAINT